MEIILIFNTMNLFRQKINNVIWKIIFAKMVEFV